MKMPILADASSRLGTESAFTVMARAGALEREGRSIINLGIGQPDFQTPSHICEAAIKAIRDGHHGYTPANGILPLREAVADHLSRHRNGASIHPDNVLIVPGGKVTMFLAITLLGEKGTEIIYPDPGFPIYRSLIDYTGATGIALPLREENDFGFCADDVLSRLTDRTRLIILNSPANPTGGVTDAVEFDKLAKGLENFPDVAVLSDEIYSRMLYGGRRHVSALDYPALADRTILLDGWSKTYAMTGWRLGYSVWPSTMIDAATRLCINSFSCVNAPAQYAGLAALTGPQTDVADMMVAFDRRRRFIVDQLNNIQGVNCRMPGGAFYAFPNISGTGLTSAQAETLFLEEAGVATIAGTSFGTNGEGFIRFSYANSQENIQLAMERIKDLIKRYTHD